MDTKLCVVRDDPSRAIRNAVERIRCAAAGSRRVAECGFDQLILDSVLETIEAERDVIETALEAIRNRST